MVKRLFAVGAGVAMLGATAMGALGAADLKNYPDMFVTDGAFNGYFVVGENAKAIDTLAVTDIAASMKTSAGTGTVTTVKGDAWQVGTGADWLEVNESIGPSGAQGVVDYITSSELGALADGELSNSKGTFKYEQKLHFDNAVGTQGSAWFQENDDDTIGLFWKITDGYQLGLYELDFLTDAESDIDASDSYALKDFEDKTLNFLGKLWTMTTAKTTSATSSEVTLVFMGGATTGTLLEGDSGAFAVGGVSYDVSITYVDTDEVAFTVNGEATGKLEDGETYTLADGTDIGVSDILYQDYAGGVHQGSFFLGANKLELKDVINDTAYSGTEVKVNEETIDGAEAYIKGTMVTWPSGTSTDGELKLDFLRVNMTAQDDIYMASGDKLSEDSELEEKELLFTQNWDFEFHGTSGDVTDNTFYLHKSGDDKYKLKFTSNDGNEVDLPLLFASAYNVLQTGDKSGDNLAINVTQNITDDDYFILANKETSTAGNSDASITVLQYQSSKNSDDDTQTLKFKNLNTGETFTRTFDDSCVFDISVEGRTHNFVNATDAPCTSDNWDIRLSSTDYVASSSTANVTTLSLRDASGSLIEIYNEPAVADLANVSSTTVGSNAFGLNLRLKYDDTDRLDDHTSAAETVWLYNLTETDTQEVTASYISNSPWNVADPDDTDVTWRYSNTGILTKHTAASSTPVELEVTVPSKSREILAYITSGATQKATGGGDMVPVTIVDATKLDSEVSAVDAQNLIVVGGPCANSVAATLLGNTADCAEGFSAGKARVLLKEQTNGKVAMLVAGFSGADTRLAGRVIAHRGTEMSGVEVEVEGTTYTDATIGAPKPKAAAPAADATTTTE